MKDLWQYLAETEKPIVLYGMGNGADKICAVLQTYGREPSDYFASDGFVRGHSFRGKTVLSYSQVCEKYDDFIILVSFASSLEDVTERVYKMAAEHELYIPDVPVAGDEIFTAEYYEAHKNELDYAKSLLCDERSRYVFDEIIKYKLTGKIEHLINSECDTDEIWSTVGEAEISAVSAYADAGAYTGDTVREAAERFENLSSVYAIEPDVKNFAKLEKNLVALSDKYGFEYRSENVCAWDKNETLEFVYGQGRGSAHSEKGITALGGASKLKSYSLPANSIDNILSGRRVDYIKYDVEGAEYEALCGSEKTIKGCRPMLLVSAYHRSSDLFRLIAKIHQINPEYKLYIRRFRYFPAWDINIYAV